MNEKKALGQRIREIREEHNLKQEDIAKGLGVDRSSYSNYELGKIRISVENLCYLADIYKTTLDYLVGRQEKTEVARVKVRSVSNVTDPIAMLNSEEQLLLVYYRTADEKKRNEIIEALANARKEYEFMDADIKADSDKEEQ